MKMHRRCHNQITQPTHATKETGGNSGTQLDITKRNSQIQKHRPGTVGNKITRGGQKAFHVHPALSTCSDTATNQTIAQSSQWFLKPSINHHIKHANLIIITVTTQHLGLHSKH